MGKLLSVMRKAGWNLGDQILSAASNVILSIVVARSVDKHVFGAFAIAFVVFGVGVALARSIVGQPLQIRYAAAAPAQQHAAIGRAHGLAVVLGVALGILCTLASLPLSGALAQALLALSVCLPGLLLQDSQRLTFFAVGKAWGAVVIDTVWTIAQFGALAALILAGRTSIDELILAWGASAALAALVGAIILQVVPRVMEWLAWLREIRDLVRYLLAEYILGLGASQVAVLLVGVIAAPQAVGAIRAAQTLLGPLNILGGACFNFTVPEIARRTHLSAKQRLLAGHAVSGLMGSATIVYVVALLLIPDWLGQEIFSDSWAGAAGVLLPLGISALFSSLANGLAGVLYGLGRADRTFRINLMKAPVIVVAVLGGTWLGGAVGAAWGMAFAEAFVLPFWYREFRLAARASRPDADPAHAGADPADADDDAQQAASTAGVADPAAAVPTQADPAVS